MANRWQATRNFGGDKSREQKDTLMVRKIILALALGGIALSATACNTVKGVGRDVESVGEAGDKVIR